MSCADLPIDAREAAADVQEAADAAQLLLPCPFVAWLLRTQGQFRRWNRSKGEAYMVTEAKALLDAAIKEVDSTMVDVEI